MSNSLKKVLAVGAVVAAAAVACSSSGSSSSSASGTADGGKVSLTVGLLTDVSGLAASGQHFAEDGLKAGIATVAKDGYQIKYVVADSGSSPTTIASAAQKLVTQDHVDVVIAHSALTLLAAPYLTRMGIPVVGAAEDGPEWITAKNMFAVYGVLHTEKVNNFSGKYVKMAGGTNVGALGYGITPTSAEATKAGALSAKSVGLKAGYVNANFPFGSTNVAPVAIAMKGAGVDALEPLTDPNTAFALMSALRQQGVDLKVTLLPGVGYGSDLLDAGPATLKEAQSVSIGLFYQPMEMNTPATQAFKKALVGVGFTKAPTIAAYDTYASILLLTQGMKAEGNSTSKASIISGLSKVHSFDAGGLYGSHPLDPSDRESLVVGPQNCEYLVKLVGNAFQTVKGALPLCGTNTGQTVK